MVKNMSLRDLEKPCFLQVLIILTENPGIIYTELKNTVEGADQTIKKAIDQLIKLGLAKEEREEEFPWRRHLYPTEKGKKIGKLLKKIEEILREAENPP